MTMNLFKRLFDWIEKHLVKSMNKYLLDKIPENKQEDFAR